MGLPARAATTAAGCEVIGCISGTYSSEQAPGMYLCFEVRVPSVDAIDEEPLCIVSVGGQTLSGDSFPSPADELGDETFVCCWGYEGSVPLGQIVAEVRLGDGSVCSDTVGVVRVGDGGAICFTPPAIP